MSTLRCVQLEEGFWALWSENWKVVFQCWAEEMWEIHIRRMQRKSQQICYSWEMPRNLLKKNWERYLNRILCLLDNSFRTWSPLSAECVCVCVLKSTFDWTVWSPPQMLLQLRNQIPRHQQASLQSSSQHFLFNIVACVTWSSYFMCLSYILWLIDCCFQQNVLWSKNLGLAMRRFRGGILMPRKTNVSSSFMEDAREIWTDLSLLKHAWKPASQQVLTLHQFLSLSICEAWKVHDHHCVI